MTSPVRVPADVDRPDRVLGPLTARQLAILGVTGLLLYGLYAVTRAFVPLPVFLLIAVPVGIAATVLALGQRDGLPLDRLALAAIRQHLSPRHRVAAPEGVRAAPAWLTAQPPETRARGRGGRRPSSAGAEPVSPAPLELPAHGVADSGAHAGVVDLGSDGLAVIAVCSTVNFSLRTPGEQEALVASFARYLHSLTAPVQFLVRAERLDLAPQIAELRAHAGGLPHPALETAARDHADYLAELTTQADLLRRQVLLVLREPLRTGPAPASAASSVLPWRHHRHGNGPVEDGVRQAAEQRLVRRLGEAIELLTPAGIVATPLDAAAATGVLAAACNPDTFLPPSAELAGADEVVTSTATFTDVYGPADDTDLAASHPTPPTHPSTAAPRAGRSQVPGPWLAEDDDWDYDDEIESR
ncbi:PrgI family protein [Amycolatopsis keratiniphila]|uniref:PrgI family protein n=1 Tax=Amycolatopsis keratiniphila TaxID=129921 RepID=UPI00087DEB8E|nr:PrgI family protein [Amycolatopsis keratiniphila]OLZ59511.1 PrgI family protein [Amycolatopsis keratiniphila subsp. nogabecina]SDU53521.1 PrgI family protein [Amycolatopsis keratiniphila]